MALARARWRGAAAARAGARRGTSGANRAASEMSAKDRLAAKLGTDQAAARLQRRGRR